jgi:hypothetical protein
MRHASLARSSESMCAVHGPGTATSSLCPRRAESTRQTPSPGLARGSSPPGARGQSGTRGVKPRRDGPDFSKDPSLGVDQRPMGSRSGVHNGTLLSVYAHYRSVVESRVPCGMPHSATLRMTRPPLQGSQSSCMLMRRLGLRIFLADSVACSMLHCRMSLGNA